ncbi:adhesin biosynthesis transcription regulatory family protein [Escherichia coli]|uniref:adhesin biosynthesis transcription regulatory family protein n=1 Tax=Escherichia coli TaxID=562 RepID=UPI002AC87202|nr:adhesin biosynthesis transcription regulatory family protein [Escherichia coli]
MHERWSNGEQIIRTEGGVFFSKNKGHKLLPAELPEEKFWLLAEISPIRSEKVLYALRDYLVLGYERKEVCARYDVSSSYFSIALGRISHVNRVVYSLAPYYADPGNDFFDRPY